MQPCATGKKLNLQKKMKRTINFSTVSAENKLQGNRLRKEFFCKNSLELSKALLGKVFSKKLASGEVLKGLIVETEAYRMDDPASHSYNGRRTDRNEAMFMGPGHSYVYFTYGMYHCFNISAYDPGSACLIRAVEPIQGVSTMRHHREQVKKKSKPNETSKKAVKSLEEWEIANGPGKLCIAFDLTRSNGDRIDLCTSEAMWLENSSQERYSEGKFDMEKSKRIGIDSTPLESRNQLWRFFIKDNFSVSTTKPGYIRKQIRLQERPK